MHLRPKPAIGVQENTAGQRLHRRHHKRPRARLMAAKYLEEKNILSSPDLRGADGGAVSMPPLGGAQASNRR